MDYYYMCCVSAAWGQPARSVNGGGAPKRWFDQPQLEQENGLAVVSRDAAVFWMKPDAGPRADARRSVVVAQLTLPSQQPWVAVMNAQGREQHYEGEDTADWSVRTVSPSTCACAASEASASTAVYGCSAVAEYAVCIVRAQGREEPNMGSLRWRRPRGWLKAAASRHMTTPAAASCNTRSAVRR